MPLELSPDLVNEVEARFRCLPAVEVVFLRFSEGGTLIEPSLIGSAVFDVMDQRGLEPGLSLEHIALKAEISRILRRDKLLRGIEDQRIKLADRLNHPAH